MLARFKLASKLTPFGLQPGKFNSVSATKSGGGCDWEVFHSTLNYWAVFGVWITRAFLAPFLLRVNAHFPHSCTQDIKNLAEKDSMWDTAKVPTHPALRSVGVLITEHGAF